MNDNPVYIAFSSQKGGVGKSAFSTLIPSCLHYQRGYNVMVFDCDYPQYSLQKLRERDLKMILNNDSYKRLAHKQFTLINKKAYPIFNCSVENAVHEAQKAIASASGPIDFVFFDLPGTVNTKGVLTTLLSMNYIFSPLIADRVVMESTLSFIEVLNNVVSKSGNTSIRSIQMFWNQVDARERSPLYEIYETVINELGFKLMKTFITDSKRFRKEGEHTNKTVFRSTLLGADPKLMKGCNLDVFLEEFLVIVKNV